MEGTNEVICLGIVNGECKNPERESCHHSDTHTNMGITCEIGCGFCEHSDKTKCIPVVKFVKKETPIFDMIILRTLTRWEELYEEA